MDEEKTQRELLILTRENNDILHKLNTQRKLETFMWIFKWLVFAFIAYGAYIAASPYIESAQQTMDSINNLSAQAEQVKNMDKKSFTDFIKTQLNKAVGK